MTVRGWGPVVPEIGGERRVHIAANSRYRSVMGFATKFWPGETFFGPAYSEKFADWGFDPNMRYLVGMMELVCAILLVIPRRQSRFLGAAGLVLLLTGAVTTHVIDDAPVYEEVSAPLHLVILLCIPAANWPAAPRELIRWPSAPTLQMQPSSVATRRS